MAIGLEAVAALLFERVMAPLVVGGAMRPGRPMGAHTALSLGDGVRRPLQPEIAALVHRARVRCARKLVPIDELPPPAGAEWSLAAALHDIVQVANPQFDAPFRRRSAARLLDLAEATIERVGAPPDARQALSRHTWFSRVLEIARTDTVVSWWSGSRTFLGLEPPERLRAWPNVRRVSVSRSPRRLLQLTPLAVETADLARVVGRFLACTPLTDLATCARGAPLFVWSAAPVALASTLAGRTLVLRALARLPPAEVDAALGRATRDALSTPSFVDPALRLLAERSLAQASGHLGTSLPNSVAADTDSQFARSLGAAVACRLLSRGGDRWTEAERRRLVVALGPAALEGEARLSTL